MRQLAHVAVALAAVLLSGGVCAAEIEPPEDAGLPVGRVAPDFSLSGQDGKQVSLGSLLKKGPVAVVFHRSADWCVYCKLQMVQLQRHLNEIEAVGGQVVAISYDPVEKLRTFANRSKITFPLLSDADSKTIDAYDVRSPDAPAEFSGISRHATFILDQSGVIRAKMFRLSYKEPSAVDALINALKEARTIKEASNTKRESTP
jgi:peroxiredoxin